MPTPANNDVLVRVRASSVCFADRRLRPRRPILGVDVREFATRYPEQVAGLVLVDPASVEHASEFRSALDEIGIGEDGRRAYLNFLRTVAKGFPPGLGPSSTCLPKRPRKTSLVAVV